MQARAIFEAAVEAGRRTGKAVIPEVMVPLVMTRPELDAVKARIVAMAEAVQKETGVEARLPGRHHDRAAARRDQGGRDRRSPPSSSPSAPTTSPRRRSASRATTRPRFLGPYTAKGILPADPFVTLDIEGVGELVKMAAERGRSHAARHQARHLRRARRRPRLHRLLRDGGARLRVLLALPRADRPPRRGAGGAGREGRQPGVAPTGGATPSLRAQRSNPGAGRQTLDARSHARSWVASSLRSSQ